MSRIKEKTSVESELPEGEARSRRGDLDGPRLVGPRHGPRARDRRGRGPPAEWQTGGHEIVERRRDGRERPVAALERPGDLLELFALDDLVEGAAAGTVARGQVDQLVERGGDVARGLILETEAPGLRQAGEHDHLPVGEGQDPEHGRPDMELPRWLRVENLDARPVELDPRLRRCFFTAHIGQILHLCTPSTTYVGFVASSRHPL